MVKSGPGRQRSPSQPGFRDFHGVVESADANTVVEQIINPLLGLPLLFSGAAALGMLPLIVWRIASRRHPAQQHRCWPRNNRWTIGQLLAFSGKPFRRYLPCL